MYRTIIVALLAVAIAMLPASMNVASAAAPTTSPVASAAQAMPDCDHYRHQHQPPAKETQKTIDHNNCVTSCALCFGFVGTDVSPIAYTITPGAMLVPVLTAEDISSLMGSPPFRPPRT